MTLQTYIAEGFLEDCEELIHRLTEKYQKVDWHKFCDCWKEMEFDILFYGRQSGPELVEFTEELLQTARLYIVTETDNVESQVVGIFIAYAITLIQPYKNLCSLRLVPKDVPALFKIENLARRENRRDVLMILGKLYVYGGTQFHVSLRERAMDISIRKYFDGSTNVPPCIARRWHGRLDRRRVAALEDIAQNEARYMDLKVKAKLAAEEAFPGTNVKVDMFKPEAKHMADSLQKLISGEGVSCDVSEGESYVNTVKKKAMKNVVDPMKHLHGLTARQKEKEKKVDSPKPKSTAKSKTKNKSGKLSSPTEHTEEPFFGFSLPSLDDPLDGDSKREGSPGAPFRGFTAEDIEQSDYMKTVTDNTNDTNGYSGKGKRVGKTSNTNFIDKTKSTSPIKATKGRSPAYSGKRKNSNEQDSTKRKKRKCKNILNKKLRLNNDFNSDDSNTFSDNNYTSDEAYESALNKSLPETLDADEPVKATFDTEASKGKDKSLPKIFTKEASKGKDKSLPKIFTPEESKVKDKALPKIFTTEASKGKEKSLPKIFTSEASKGKELTIQSKGVVKHFVEYEVNDIVIRTERDAPPKDIEIEYIDNYTGANAYEEVCEVSDDEERRANDGATVAGGVSSRDEVNVTIEECDEFGDTRDDDGIEVFQIVTEDAEESLLTQNTGKLKPHRNKTKPEQNTEVNSSSIHERYDETVKKLLSKKHTRSLERRRLKQPNLRSKLKKMGLLPVANFDDDDAN